MATAGVLEASRRLGYRSRSTLLRLIQSGQLADFIRESPTGALQLELEGLRERVQQLVQFRPNSVAHQPQGPPSWPEIASLANSYLDCDAWPGPPWTADQWATLGLILEMAVQGEG